MEKDYNCLIGESDMSDFTTWWESHQSYYLILYCRKGEAEMQLQFVPYVIGEGQLIIVSPDMFPAFTSRSADFRAFYCIMDRDFAEYTAYGVPSQFYACQFNAPAIRGGYEMDLWTKILEHSVNEYTDYECRKDILKNIIHNIYLVYYNLWRQQHGDTSTHREMKHKEQLCMKFYDLVFDHFAEHRDIGFYADQLCVTPNYLAMIVRQICKESPKQAIDRQVILEMKHTIKTTTMTAEQMAVRLHFPDTSYMCRYFKKRTGMSISEYRAST